MRSSHAIWAVPASLLLMLGLYVGAYLCMLSPWKTMLNADYPFSPYRPAYRLGGKLMESFFEPIHQIDRKIRPVYWGDDFYLEGPLFPE